MMAKVIVGLVVLSAVLYFGYTSFMKGEVEVDERNVRASFQSMKLAITSKNKQAISNLLAPAFSDGKITRTKLAESLAQPRKSYNVSIKNINIRGPLGVVNYSRSQTFDNSEPVTEQIVGETWKRDDKNPMIWRLYRLASNDKGFRAIAVTPRASVANGDDDADADVIDDELAVRIDELETSNRKWRYASFGRRDPFRPLIELAEEITTVDVVCDPGRDREILEGYELMSLKLTGIMKDGNEHVALIKAPDGKGYSVRQEQYVGKKCGKVLAVQPDHMMVREQKLFRDDSKRKPGKGVRSVFKPVESKLKLRPEEG